MTRAIAIGLVIPLSGCSLLGGLFGGGSESSSEAIDRSETYRRIADRIEEIENTPEDAKAEELAELQLALQEYADYEDSKALIDRLDLIAGGLTKTGTSWGYIAGGILGLGGLLFLQGKRPKRRL